MNGFRFLLLSSFVSVLAAFSLQAAPPFRLPEIPANLTDPSERADYLSIHYWDNYDFTDISLISDDSGISEQAFVDFVDFLPIVSNAQEALDSLFRRSSVKPQQFSFFVDLSEKYLYSPFSPMRSEQLHIMALRSILSNPAMDEAQRLHSQHLLDMALKNSVGTVAADFEVLSRQGQRLRLSDLSSEYILLFFNDPGCRDCLSTKGALRISKSLKSLLESSRMILLSVCTEGNTPSYQKSVMPDLWTDTFDPDQHIYNDLLYDLSSLPSMYLLDSSHKVLLKNPSVTELENYLQLLQL